MEMLVRLERSVVPAMRRLSYSKFVKDCEFHRFLRSFFSSLLTMILEFSYCMFIRKNAGEHPICPFPRFMSFPVVL
jgi:hypothetical protein